MTGTSTKVPSLKVSFYRDDTGSASPLANSNYHWSRQNPRVHERSSGLHTVPIRGGEINMSMTNEVSYQGGDRSIACSVALRLNLLGLILAKVLW